MKSGEIGLGFGKLLLPDALGDFELADLLHDRSQTFPRNGLYCKAELRGKAQAAQDARVSDGFRAIAAENAAFVAHRL